MNIRIYDRSAADSQNKILLIKFGDIEQFFSFSTEFRPEHYLNADKGIWWTENFIYMRVDTPVNAGYSRS